MEKELNKEELEHLIVDLLHEQSLCVIATCSGDVPRASTVEYFPMAATIYILTEGGVKIENIIRNPNVSIAIHAPFAGWQTVRGIQMTGIAEIGRRGSIVYEEGVAAFNKRRGRIGTVPDIMNIIKVTPHKIEYLDAALGEKGFKVRHVLVC
ncbi:MAG: pyridoxamine 5'-phosphate oxidase family protein [Nitrospirae bacterium]|nr:pyridoxamine 5'-phosphate oxidase family protein [Nitrospirota bacterium]